jgi:hypothetical protein
VLLLLLMSILVAGWPCKFYILKDNIMIQVKILHLVAISGGNLNNGANTGFFYLNLNNTFEENLANIPNY